MHIGKQRPSTERYIGLVEESLDSLAVQTQPRKAPDLIKIYLIGDVTIFIRKSKAAEARFVLVTGDKRIERNIRYRSN